MKLPQRSSLNLKYGIVIDSGSSGSRIQIYKWEDQAQTLNTIQDQTILTSPPKITQEKGWTSKISPGISTYGGTGKTKKIWTDHYSKLMKFAEDIIPPDKYEETPVYVLATAGMRLLPQKKQKEILKETCLSLQKNTRFYLPSCQDFVQIIDGETEGIYGWLSLNYLMGQFDGYEKSKAHESIGFMDMGGASTQIAFVPSSQEEIEKHNEDLSKVTLRNINGETQEWNVFVETWLGFGANEARKRYLNQLINLSITNPILGNEINDPCLPRGADVKYETNNIEYTIKGLGNYEMCLKEIYPLLMKNIPCKDTPCLFNGIHGPKLNFEKDKFIGISEYWYTANDVFQSGGEYNFHTFNEKVRDYCESDWSQILKNSDNGQYSNLDPEKFLKDACFKASWVINILHDGFELPRLGLDISDEGESEEKKKMEKTHIPFKSADSINGGELSWTLGKILLFASSQIEPAGNQESQIGINPSEISGKEFVPGGAIKGNTAFDSDDDDDDFEGGNTLYSIIFLLLLLFFVYNFGKSHINKYIFRHRKLNFLESTNLQNKAALVISKVPILNKYFSSVIPYSDFLAENDANIQLEEGTISSSTSPDRPPSLSVLRTRSTVNLTDGANDNDINNTIRNYGFINKPFVVPKRNATNILGNYANNGSRESLHRVSSNSSMNKTRSVE